jgi:hypothetical protein
MRLYIHKLLSPPQDHVKIPFQKAGSSKEKSFSFDASIAQFVAEKDQMLESYVLVVSPNKITALDME